MTKIIARFGSLWAGRRFEISYKANSTRHRPTVSKADQVTFVTFEPLVCA